MGAIIGFRGQQEARHQAELAENSANRAKAAEMEARAAESQAKTAEKQARAAEEKALQARDKALRNQSLSLSFLSQQTTAGGDTEAAILLALEALPKNMNSPERPFLIEAEAALYQALLQNRQGLVFHHDAGVTDAAFNPSGDRIVTSSYDKTARIWSVKDGTQITILKGHRDALERVMFSPDGAQVITVARDGTARTWNSVSGKQLLVIPVSGDFQTAKFSPNGTRVLTLSENNAPVIWDAQTGKKVVALQDSSPEQRQQWFGYASFTPDGEGVATIADGSTIHIWSAKDGKPITTFVAFGMWPDDVAFSPDGKRMLSSSWDTGSFGGPSRLWDVASGKEIAPLGGHKSDTRSGTFSHDGRFVATISVDGTARLWDGVTGQLLSLLGAESGGLRHSNTDLGSVDLEINAAFSPDDKFLATVALGGKVHIWEVKSGLKYTTIQSHKGLVEHVAFSPAGNVLLTASRDGTARLWDVDGVLTTSLRHQQPPTFATFSPDGTRLVTGGRNRVGHIWDVTTGKEIAQLETEGGPLQHAAFSPDGRQIATASQNGSVDIWDAANGQQIIRLKG